MTRSNYALITALYMNKDRGLYTDIYFPIIKYVIVKIFCGRCMDDCYASAAGVCEKVNELFGLQIPRVVDKVLMFHISLLKKNSTFAGV